MFVGIATSGPEGIRRIAIMTTDTDTAKIVSTSKGAVTRSEKALADAMASGDMDAVIEGSAVLQSAKADLSKAERAHEASTREEFLEKLSDARANVRAALDAVGDSIEIMRRAGHKYIDVEITGEGAFTVSTRSGQRGVQPGTTRNVERYAISVAGNDVEFTAGNLIKNLGPSMDNYDDRIEAIIAKRLTRKQFAQEITAKLGGTVIA